MPAGIFEIFCFPYTRFNNATVVVSCSTEKIKVLSHHNQRVRVFMHNFHFHLIKFTALSKPIGYLSLV